MPREHGAYAELTFPLLSGLLLGGPTRPAALYVVAALSLFLAHEPVAVLLGVRGRRLQAELGDAARRRAAGLLAVGAVTGVAAVVLAPPLARLLLLLPASLAAILVPLVPARKVKTLPGEVLVAAAMAANHLPLAAAGGRTGLLVWAPAVVWFTGFALAVVTVHSIKVRFKGLDRGRWTVVAAPVLAGLVVAGAVAAVFVFQDVRRWIALAVVPIPAAVLVLGVVPVHPRHLKRVGWTLVGADLVTLLLMLMAR